MLDNGNSKCIVLIFPYFVKLKLQIPYQGQYIISIYEIYFLCNSCNVGVVLIAIYTVLVDGVYDLE